MTVKSSISLTDEQHSFARELVDAGRYSSVSAVLQQGSTCCGSGCKMTICNGQR